MNFCRISALCMMAMCLAGCASYDTMVFMGDSPAVRRTPGAAGVNISQARLESLSVRQRVLCLDLYTDSLVLIFPGTGPKSRIDAVTHDPTVEAWWLSGWPEKWRDFISMSPAQRESAADAIRLDGQFRVDWSRTNDFRVHTDLHSTKQIDVVVRGDFVAKRKYEPGPWFAGVKVLFGIPIIE